MAASPDDIVIRLLDVSEAGHVVDAITAAYGETYDVPWAYDTAEIRRRMAHGQLISAAAFTSGGDLLSHVALTRHGHDDHVVHAGQAVTLAAARGHHVFTRVFAHLAEWTAARRIFGIYAEATAAWFGKEPKLTEHVEPRQAEVIDLMERLRASLQGGGEHKGARKSTRRTSTKPARARTAAKRTKSKRTRAA